ncbi:NAD-dependent succinate-semialdehyde dehydrogenase [Corynebacterium flavescens]
MSYYAVNNPFTGEVETTYPTATDVDVTKTIEIAHSAFAAWKHSELSDRQELLHQVARLHLEHRSKLARLIVREMGKPLEQAYGEVDISAAIYRYYAQHGPRLLEDEELDYPGTARAFIRKEGVGAVFGIMPWNFPLYQVARFAAPNIMNGNTVILKHAPQCPASASAIEELFELAGSPLGLYTNIFATDEQCATIIADRRVQGVSLTGSERAGSAVASIAGANLKKVVLELGGNDAFLLLDTTDLDKVVDDAARGRLINSGQACNASKRFIVLDKYYDAFLSKLSAIFEQTIPADPMKEGTTLGPLSSLKAAENLENQVSAGIAEGARIVVGGLRKDKNTCLFPATILDNVTPDMKIFHEELFGPVAIVFRVADEKEAIGLANNSSFGLGATVYTEHSDTAERVARSLDTGMVFINEPEGTAPELPFGGVKRSGFGRELGPAGIGEFINAKMIKIPRFR